MDIGDNVFCLGVVICAAAVLITAIIKGWRP
jgi:hypothetical protein